MEKTRSEWPLPEHPELRQLAEEMERSRRVAEIFDDPGTLSYRPLAQLEGATEKATRDAGAIPVAAI